jgi:hypothetical protein
MIVMKDEELSIWKEEIGLVPNHYIDHWPGDTD